MLGFDHPLTHDPSALTDMETEDQLASLIPVLFAIRLVTVRFSSSVAFRRSDHRYPTTGRISKVNSAISQEIELF